MSAYIFSEAASTNEKERLTLLERIFDPRTQGYLERLGLQSGKHVLEAGFGAGGIVHWMDHMVGAKGRVLAVDRDASHLDTGMLSGSTEVVEADLLEFEFPPASFDLIHARYVLLHIDRPERLLTKLKAALRPGGWILIEDADFTLSRAGGAESGRDAFERVREAVCVMYHERHLNAGFGSTVPERFAAMNFEYIGSDVFAPLVPGRSDMAQLMKLSIFALRERLLETGCVKTEDLETYLHLCDNPSVWNIYYGTVAAWGRKPWDKSDAGQE